MKNNENNAKKSMTMPEVKAALEEAVNSYNKSTDAAERTKLEIEAKDLVAQYNAISLLTDYAKFMADDKPIVAIAKAYKCPTIGVKFAIADALVEGKAKKVKVASVEDSTKTHDLVNFLEWAEKHNKKIAAAADWKSKMEDARTAINGEFQKVMESDDGYKISKGVVKSNMQALFDSVVFVAGESGKNAIYPNKDGVNIIISIAADLKEAIEDGEVEFTLQFLGKSKWRSIIFKVLHLSVKGKKLNYTYGDPEETVNAEAQSEEAPEAEAEAEAQK